MREEPKQETGLFARIRGFMGKYLSSCRSKRAQPVEEVIEEESKEEEKPLVRVTEPEESNHIDPEEFMVDLQAENARKRETVSTKRDTLATENS